MNVIRKYWHFMLAAGIFAFEAVVLLLLRKNIYVGICDNLDLFITQLKMMRDNGAFFAHHYEMPVLGLFSIGVFALQSFGFGFAGHLCIYCRVSAKACYCFFLVHVAGKLYTAGKLS